MSHIIIIFILYSFLKRLLRSITNEKRLYLFSSCIYQDMLKIIQPWKSKTFQKFKKLSVQLSSPYLFGNERSEETIQHFKHGECQVGVHCGYNFLHVVAQELNGRLKSNFKVMKHSAVHELDLSGQKVRFDAVESIFLLLFFATILRILICLHSAGEDFR